jgi:hypothetical protein
MAVSTLFLLAVVVLLSAATRQPCPQVNAGPWHIWKAGRMSSPEVRKTGDRHLSVETQAERPALQQVPPATPAIHLPYQQTLPDLNSVVLEASHLRAPPVFG